MVALRGEHWTAAVGDGAAGGPGAPDTDDGAGDVLDVGAAGVAARKAPRGKRKMAIASLVTVAGFLALDLLVARANARA